MAVWIAQTCEKCNLQMNMQLSAEYDLYAKIKLSNVTSTMEGTLFILRCYKDKHIKLLKQKQ